MRQFITVFLLTVMVGLAGVASAQADYYPQAEGQANDYRNFQSLEIPLPKASTLLKLGVSMPLVRQSSFTGSYAALALDATAEQKLVGGLALVGGLETNVGFSLDGRGARFFSLELPVALRYYFSLTRREKQRTDRHSFFSNYVAIKTYNVLFSNLTYPLQGSLFDLQRYQRGRVGSAITNSGSVGDQFLFLNYAVLQIGAQRCVWTRYYMDVNVLVPIAALIYNRYEYTLATPPFITLTFGVGKWRK